MRISLPLASDTFHIRVLNDGVMVLRRNDEETTLEFTDLGEVLKYLRAQGERGDAQLTIVGYDGRKIMDTSI